MFTIHTQTILTINFPHIGRFMVCFSSQLITHTSHKLPATALGHYDAQVLICVAIGNWLVAATNIAHSNPPPHLTNETREYHIFTMATVVRSYGSVTTVNQVDVGRSTIHIIQQYWSRSLRISGECGRGVREGVT